MKKSSKRKGATIYIIAFVFVVALVTVFLWEGKYIFKGPEVRPRVFTVEKGEGVRDIARNLKDSGFIRSKLLFAFLALLQGERASLMAGAYEISGAMNVSEVLSKISSGDVLQEEITVIEGWTLKDIASLLQSRGVALAERFLELVSAPAKNKFSDMFGFLKEKPGEVGLEGYLFPDTYQVVKGEPIEDFVEKMLENFEKKITSDLKQEIASQKRTLFEVLTMASLLEKEVKTYEDKQLVAGLLWKRLKAGWPLQVDATLTYLTGKPTLQLTKDDLALDSVYNTYKYGGLPLGPICNPGLDSIKAAVYYKDSPYWFYLTTKDGKTVFSRTLEEHALNKQRYLK